MKPRKTIQRIPAAATPPTPAPPQGPGDGSDGAAAGAGSAIVSLGGAGDPAPRPVHPVTAYIDSLAGGVSQRTMEGALDLAASVAAGLSEPRKGLRMDAAWWTLGGAQTGALRAALAARYAPATCNKVLAAVRGVLRACRRARLMDADALADALDFKRVAGSREAAGRALSPDEIARLTDAAARRDGDDGDDERTDAALRDLAMVGTLAGGGLRRDELVHLTREDVGPKGLTVMGKGNKQRVVPLGPTPRAWLDAWIAARGDAPGPLFTRMGRGGPPGAPGGRLSTQSVYATAQRIARRAGVSPLPTPHDFRRTFITELLDRGVDVFTAAKLAGHANVETTRRYDRRPEQAMADATRTLDALFTPKGSAATPGDPNDATTRRETP